MTGMIAELGPIFLLWSVPLIPLIYTGSVTIVESIRNSPRRAWAARPAFALRSRSAVDSETS